MTTTTILAETWARIAPPTWTTADLAAWLGGRASTKAVATRGTQLGLWHRRHYTYHPGRPDVPAGQVRAAALQARREMVLAALPDAESIAGLAVTVGVPVRAVHRLLTAEERGSVGWRRAAAELRDKEDAIIREAWAAGLRAAADIAQRHGLPVYRVKRAITRLRAQGETPPRKPSPKRDRSATSARPIAMTPELRLLRALADEPWSTASELGATEADLEPLVRVRLVQRGTGGAVALTDDGWLMVGT